MVGSDIKQTLSRVERKAQSLIDRYASLRDAKAQADNTIRQLRAEVERLSEENKQLLIKVEHLTVVTTTHPNRKDVELSRAKLSNLVREIDKCIADLND